MQLFYNSEINQKSKTFLFDKEESKHIIKVLRKKELDKIYITNGLGFLFETEIITASEKKCEVKIIKVSFFEPSKFYTHIAVAPTKMNDRIEWFLEKATEIGIHEITPIICDRSERKNFNTERAEKILISAMKQSKQYYLPKLNEAIDFKKFIKNSEAEQKLIAHCVDGQKKYLYNVLIIHKNILVLIGPEGDFTESEINFALENNFTDVSLGESRLRTETAALVACHTIALKNN